jgi:hypothetical protein
MLVAGTLFTLCLSPGPSSATILTNVSLAELVFLLNQHTPLQVNLEQDTDRPPVSFQVDDKLLPGMTIRGLIKLLAPATNYTVVSLERVHVICPRNGRMMNGVDFGAPAPPLRLTKVHPFVAFQSLAKAVPFSVNILDPCCFPGPDTVNPTEMTVQWWKPEHVRLIDLDTRRLSVREAMSAIFCGQHKAFWIAYPLDAKINPAVPPTTRLVYMNVYTTNQMPAWSVYYHRTEAYLREMREGQELRHRRLERLGLSTNATFLEEQQALDRLKKLTNAPKTPPPSAK